MCDGGLQVRRLSFYVEITQMAPKMDNSTFERLILGTDLSPPFPGPTIKVSSFNDKFSTEMYVRLTVCEKEAAE